MRLKRGNDATPRERRTRGGKGRANLGRVMSVIVHYLNALRGPQTLKPSLDAAERCQSCPHRLQRDAQRQTASDRGERVGHVMRPGDPQLDFAEHLTIILDLEQ